MVIFAAIWQAAKRHCRRRQELAALFRRGDRAPAVDRDAPFFVCAARRESMWVALRIWPPAGPCLAARGHRVSRHRLSNATLSVRCAMETGGRPPCRTCSRQRDRRNRHSTVLREMHRDMVASMQGDTAAAGIRMSGDNKIDARIYELAGQIRERRASSWEEGRSCDIFR
jgi:hypothetical protein